ncbi:MAG: excisionase [Roseiarcus sp.]|uniref:excisionase n=1 Tax=Roseiarcus sp. TaxID=1969460 RepID=UPI003C65A40D
MQNDASPLKLAVDNDAPMRLADAIEIAFPRGGITVSGLRKEAAKGRLIIERIAGKDFVTLAAINAMRAECRIADPKRSRSGPSPSKTSASQAALDSLLLNVKRQTGAASGRKLAS